MVIFSEPVTQPLQHELRDLLGSAAVRVDLHAVRRADALAVHADPAGFLGSCLTPPCRWRCAWLTSVLNEEASSEDPSDFLQRGVPKR
jgi:hypothetical protein